MRLFSVLMHSELPAHNILTHAYVSAFNVSSHREQRNLETYLAARSVPKIFYWCKCCKRASALGFISTYDADADLGSAAAYVIPSNT